MASMSRPIASACWSRRAGALFVVSGFEEASASRASAAWTAGYLAMAAARRRSGFAAALSRPSRRSPPPPKPSTPRHAARTQLDARLPTARDALRRFPLRDVALVVLAFVVLFKFTDAFAGAMTAPFVIDLGFSRNDYATIIKGVGFAATLIGGFAGGYVARALSAGHEPVDRRHPAGGWRILHSLAGARRQRHAWLTFAITVENFTSAIGTVIFVALSVGAVQEPAAHGDAIRAAHRALGGRAHLSFGGGRLYRGATGWAWFFVICASRHSGLALLAWLQARGHFGRSKARSRWDD